MTQESKEIKEQQEAQPADMENKADTESDKANKIEDKAKEVPNAPADEEQDIAGEPLQADKPEQATAQQASMPAEEASLKPAEQPAADSGEKKRKKINLMSAKELDAKLKYVKDKMGNLKSRYAKQLLRQKDLTDNQGK
jgi:hypothetical protein